MSKLSVPSPRILSPNISHRRSWHDYSARSVYLVTLIRNESVSPFSTYVARSTGQDFEISPTGILFIHALEAVDEECPGLDIGPIVVLPDYVQFVIYNGSETKLSLDQIVAQIKTHSNRLYFEECENNPTYPDPSTLTSMFAGGFDDRVARRRSDVERFREFVLKATDHYRILLNPSCFSTRFKINRIEGRIFEAIGNPMLLDDPQIVAVRISSKFSSDELMKHKSEWFRTVMNGGVLVSPFVSGAEYKVLKWAMANGGRAIRLLPNGFAPDFSPDVETQLFLKSGRFLLMAPATYDPTLTRPPRSLCIAMNDTASLIANNH